MHVLPKHSLHFDIDTSSQEIRIYRFDDEFCKTLLLVDIQPHLLSTVSEITTFKSNKQQHKVSGYLECAFDVLRRQKTSEVK